MASTPEYLTMRSCCTEVIGVVKGCYVTLGSELFSVGLLSESQWERLSRANEEDIEKATRIVSALIEKTRYNPISYHTFVEILENHHQPYATDLLVRMKSHYDSLNDTSVTGSEEESSLPFSRATELDKETKANLEGRLLDEAKQIELVFGKFISGFHRSLKAHSIDPSEIAEDLLTIKAITKQIEADEVPELFCLIRRELRSSETVGDIFYHIGPYFSYFNYEVIANIVDHHGTDKDQDDLKIYLERFEDFCRRRALEIPTLVDCHDPTSTAIRFKIESDFKSVYTVKAVKMFRAKLCKILGVSELCLRLLSIEEGCILLTFLIPTFVVPHVFPLTRDQARALSAEGVTRYALGEEPYLYTDVHSNNSQNKSPASQNQQLPTLSQDTQYLPDTQPSIQRQDAQNTALNRYSVLAGAIDNLSEKLSSLVQSIDDTVEEISKAPSHLAVTQLKLAGVELESLTRDSYRNVLEAVRAVKAYLENVEDYFFYGNRAKGSNHSLMHNQLNRTMSQVGELFEKVMEVCTRASKDSVEASEECVTQKKAANSKKATTQAEGQAIPTVDKHGQLTVIPHEDEVAIIAGIEGSFERAEKNFYELAKIFDDLTGKTKAVDQELREIHSELTTVTRNAKVTSKDVNTISSDKADTDSCTSDDSLSMRIDQGKKNVIAAKTRVEQTNRELNRRHRFR